MYNAVTVTASRGTQSILPAALVALGLLLQGCGERQETPVGPPSPAGTDEAALSADKEHNAVDLGSPAASAHIVGAHVVSAFATVAAAAAGVGGELYVLGGRNAGSSLNKVEAYDPVTNRWSTRASMPTARSGLGVGVINDLVYAVAGRRNSSTIAATNERFTP